MPHDVLFTRCHRGAEDRHALLRPRLPLLVHAQVQARKEISRNLLPCACPIKHAPAILIHEDRIASLIHRVHFAQIHIVKFNDDAQRRSLLRLLRLRISALRPHEALHVAQGAIHQTCLNPQIMREQHTRPLTQKQLPSKPSEFVTIQKLSMHVLLTLRLVVMSTKT